MMNAQEAIGIAQGAVFGGQLLVLWGQLRVFRGHSKLLEGQNEILREQARWRRDEALGTFYRTAFDLVDEFKKANVLPMGGIPADFGTHPRQVLREAGGRFSPLGSDVVRIATQCALRLDDYFTAVKDYDAHPSGLGGAERLQSIQAIREQVGNDLDLANAAISQDIRWRYDNGIGYNFRSLCSPPPGLSFG